MTQESAIVQYNNNNYAVVDLGSNSFHLLITELNGNTVSVTKKVKRKVRLAAGLSKNNQLSDEAIERGLDCLSLFSQHLQTIPLENITIVATATLRIATNSQAFINAANTILPLNINLLSGEQEAQTIYAGVAYTSQNNAACEKRLVLDIGGASTEIVVGEAYTAKYLNSLNIGCVSFKARFFSDDLLCEANFQQAIEAAKHEIATVANAYLAQGWDCALGSSGTMQALIEILRFQQRDEAITLSFIGEIKQLLIDSKHIDSINIAGLRQDRIPVLASGLAILTALFETLKINKLTLSTGALREGLLFQLLPQDRLISFIK